MRVWVDSGGRDSYCKDGNYDCCIIAGFRCVLVGDGDGARNGGGILVAVVVVIGYWGEW